MLDVHWRRASPYRYVNSVSGVHSSCTCLKQLVLADKEALMLHMPLDEACAVQAATKLGSMFRVCAAFSQSL
jgi:hypothetical protein